ncbi:MAG: aminoacyl-tRNA hydrolase [Bacteroidetes bacterium]|nr:aminoacyl-tRNA hydrolase [Bacteroidota bacterium]
MKYLIVGLGNPGAEYENTRHNAGFKVVDKVASALGGTWQQDRLGWVARCSTRGRHLILLKPNTYMNLSGKAVAYWLQAEKLRPENMLVITDDLAIPAGTLRLKTKGSDGGHNGLKSIQTILGTQEYPRLRFGVGNQFAPGRQVDYVLGEWSQEEKPLIEETLQRAADGVTLFATMGPGLAMTQLNAR